MMPDASHFGPEHLDIQEHNVWINRSNAVAKSEYFPVIEADYLPIKQRSHQDTAEQAIAVWAQYALLSPRIEPRVLGEHSGRIKSFSSPTQECLDV
jgi:hypothetical protein